MIGIEVYERRKTCKNHDGGELSGPCYCNTEYRFRVRARNGEIVVQSEGYTTREAAEKGIRALRRALLPGTRDAEVLAKAWDEGMTAGVEWVAGAPDPRNPYRPEVPPNG